MYVTVYTHKGLEICTISPATPEQFGYIIDYVDYVGESYNLIQDAINAIDRRIT